MIESGYSNAMAGDFILRGDKAKTYKLKRLGNTGQTLIRVFPCVKSGVVEPQYINTDREFDESSRHVSDAFCRAEVVLYWGSKKYSMITEITGDAAFSDFPRSPARLFYYAIRDYDKKSPELCPVEWRKWMLGDKPMLTKPVSAVFMQGAMFMDKGKSCTSQGKPLFPVVLAMYKQTAIDSLIGKITSKVDPSKPFSAQNNQLGDLLDCVTGGALTITPGVKYNPQLKKDQVAYDVAYVPNTNGMYSISPDFAKQWFLDWKSLLAYPTLEQQLNHMVETFSPAAVKFALEETIYGPHLPDICKNAAAPAPGNSYPAYPSQQFQGQPWQQPPQYAPQQPPQYAPQQQPYAPAPQYAPQQQMQPQQLPQQQPAMMQTPPPQYAAPQQFQAPPMMAPAATMQQAPAELVYAPQQPPQAAPRPAGGWGSEPTTAMDTGDDDQDTDTIPRQPVSQGVPTPDALKQALNLAQSMVDKNKPRQ